MKKVFDEIPYLETDRLILRKMDEREAAALGSMARDESVYRYLPAFLTELQYDDPLETIRQFYGECFTAKESVFLGIFRREGAFCGMAELYGCRAEYRKISLGYRLIPAAWGQGIATEAVLRVIEYLYHETDTGIITASVITENHASANVLRKAGFQMTAAAVPEDWGFPEPRIVDKWFR